MDANPERAFYLAEIEAARAAAQVSGRPADPELAVDVGRRRLRGAGGGLADEGTTWAVSVSQLVEWPGRLSLRKAIANGEVELAELGLARFVHALEARTRQLTFDLHAAAERAVAVRTVAGRFTELRETFLVRDPSALTPLLETRVIEAAELGLQRRATEAELEERSARAELNLLRGADPDAPLAVDAPVLELPALPDTAVLVAAARANNFEFRQRTLELEQQVHAVRLARNERNPGVRISPYVGGDSTEGREVAFGVGFSLPLPVTGRGTAGVAAAESRRRQAETAAFVAERELLRHVLEAARTFAAKRAECLRWAPDSVARFGEAAELADRHYRLGAVPVATYVELQTSYLDAVEALAATRSEALASLLELQQLTGLNLVDGAKP